MLFGGAVPSSSNFYANDTWIFEGPFVTSGNLPAGTLGVPYKMCIRDRRSHGV